MEYRFETEGNILKVFLSGRLVASCAEGFKETMFEHLKGARQIVVNRQKMEHVDSSGLGALVSILQWVNSNGGLLKLCCLQPRPKIVFDITKVYRIFEVYDTEQEALAAFSEKS